jgi:hypothetical protein
MSGQLFRSAQMFSDVLLVLRHFLRLSLGLKGSSQVFSWG